MKPMLTQRPTQVYNLPLSAECPILHPEQAILRFTGRPTLDVGALCYLVRDFAPKGGPRAGLKVELASLCRDRIKQIQKLINQISEELQHSGLRVATIYSYYAQFFAFINWADTHGWQQVLAERDQAPDAARAYVNHLRECVRRMELSLNSAAKKQTFVLKIMATYHEIEDLGRGMNLLYSSGASAENTKPPCEIAQSRTLSLCESLFNGMCELVLEQKPFPHRMTMPTYLDLPENTLWVFPAKPWFSMPTMLDKRSKNFGYNYAQGRLTTLEEMREINALPGLAEFAGNKDWCRTQIIRGARKQLETANGDVQHHQRRKMAYLAMNAFFMLFLAQTGMNLAQATQLSWADDFEIEASHQAFRTVKWRAGGKLVSFELPIAFMPTFRKYLALRTYLLNGQDCDLLFFNQGYTFCDTPKAASTTNQQDSVYLTLKRIDPTLVPVKSREWRAAKSDWLVRNTDPATAAIVLQNTEKTVLKSYAAGSETTHLAEMSDFLNEVALRVLPKDEPVEGGVTRAVGVCASYGTPEPISPSAMRPDCKGPEGCLFCDKFKVHADVKDTRKLISCRYCLQQSAPLIGSAERVKETLGPIFERIEVILVEVRMRDAAMVEQVTREVEEDGELDPYWAQKYEMLISLGAIA